MCTGPVEGRGAGESVLHALDQRTQFSAEICTPPGGIGCQAGDIEQAVRLAQRKPSSRVADEDVKALLDNYRLWPIYAHICNGGVPDIRDVCATEPTARKDEAGTYGMMWPGAYRRVSNSPCIPSLRRPIRLCPTRPCSSQVWSQSVFTARHVSAHLSPRPASSQLLAHPVVSAWHAHSAPSAPSPIGPSLPSSSRPIHARSRWQTVPGTRGPSGYRATSGPVERAGIQSPRTVRE